LVLATRQPAAWLNLADRVLLLEGGAVTCDAPVPLPRLQHNPVLALLRQRLLLRLKQAGLDLHIQS
ncbi:MAG: aliphatic sulfonate ABC transporter ATP-binding protein, partial [Aquincola sp.]|nr:aliphatic sulfonate ABC transporter ATP-binding protein [Aquincola sp.]